VDPNDISGHIRYSGLVLLNHFKTLSQDSFNKVIEENFNMLVRLFVFYDVDNSEYLVEFFVKICGLIETLYSN
jgi:hypothetical protein